MDLSRRFILFSTVVTLAGCGGDDSGASPAPPPPPPPPPGPPGTVTLTYSFANDFAGWEAAYADYTLGQEATIGFAFGHERLPAPLADRTGIYLSSDNRSDDVFMYLTRQVDGLVPNTRYRVDLQIEIATNAPPNCPGAGGSPGESVFVKAGASAVRPEKVVAAGNFVTVNFDKGDQSQSGANAVVIGNFAQSTAGGSCLNGPYQRKTLSSGTAGPAVRSDGNGRLWLVAGTDSGFEGFTKIYYLEIRATFTPV